MTPSLRAAFEGSGSSPTELFEQTLASFSGPDRLSQMLYVDTKLWLPDLLLARADRTTMAASLEARVPLLDHRVVELAAALPSRLKLRGFVRKYLLRRVARELLPAAVVTRPKRGFPIPMAAWLRGSGREFARDLLSSATVVRRGLFEPLYVERLIAEHENRTSDNSSLLWGLICLELWHQLFLDSGASGRGRFPVGRAALPGGVRGPR